MRRERIAHYRIEGLLGAGGMGEVWAAFDERLERRVAIKVLPEERASDDARARMLREARAAGALHHPGLVPVYDTGEIDGVSYIVMEWVDGETVADRIAKRGALPPADAVALIAQAADALGAAHAAGIVHRDIKAANLMIDARGQVRVLDFGLSKRLGLAHAPTGEMSTADAAAAAAQIDAAVPVTEASDAPDDAGDRIDPSAPTAISEPSAPGLVRGTLSSRTTPDPVTVMGARMGTPGYAAPELLAGGDADARSDVFSLAVVLYELVTGARPFSAETWSELERRMRAGATPPSVASKGAVGPAFDAVLARAFAPRRADRFESVGALVEAARAAITPPTAGATPRTGLWLALTGGAVAIAGGTAIVLASSGGRGREPGTPAPSSPPPAAATIASTSFGAPRGLTTLGGCAEGPIFVDDHTIVFDLSRDGAVDLWAVGRDGAGARALVASPAWDWRPARGRRPGEVLFLRTDMTDDRKDAVVSLDVATGAARDEIAGFTSGVAARGDAIYYVVGDGTDVRRRRGDRDDSYQAIAPELRAQQLAASPAADRFVFTAEAYGAPLRLCTFVAGAAPSCVDERVYGGRPDFAPGGALYFGTPDGVRRRDLDTGAETTALPAVRARAGLAIAPDARSLVFSECDVDVRLVDVTAPQRAIVDDPHPTAVIAGPDGALAWVHEEPAGSHLVLRRKDGSTTELVPARFGRITFPSFSADGAKIAFLAGGKHPGIHLVDTGSVGGAAASVVQLTDGATDYWPFFTRDRRVVFTRFDDLNVPHVFAVDLDGGAPVQTSAASREAEATNPATGQVLVSAGDHLLWWDPVTGKTSAPLAGDAAPRSIAVSPNGRWLLLQTGAGGHTFWRAPFGALAERVQVADLPTDDTVDAATIDDDGRVFASVSVWRGELSIVDAAPGTTIK